MLSDGLIELRVKRSAAGRISEVVNAGALAVRGSTCPESAACACAYPEDRADLISL